ncbi:VTT domain-containing protein [Treponema sp. OttesenSCG-928-L16]|nr:VTT domain-containing protein [Treponema sp. OttesenSCG-928-L16]
MSGGEKLQKNVFFFLIGFLLVSVVLCILLWPFFMRLNDPVYRQQFKSWIEKFGIGGWFIVFGIQFIQIVIAVIPGEPVELLAGMAYGSLGGLLICLLGCAAASSLIFLLVRKFGTPLIVRLFGTKKLNKYKFLNDTQKTAAAVFILFLIPGTPKDMLTYIVPLSRLRMPQFLLISLFARIPSILTSTIMGDSMVQGYWYVFLIIFLFTALIGFLGMKYKEKITDFFRPKDEVPPE